MLAKFLEQISLQERYDFSHLAVIDHALFVQRVYLELKLIFDAILFVHLDLGGLELYVQNVQFFFDLVGFIKFFGASLYLELFDIVVHLLHFFVSFFDVLLQPIYGLLYFCLSF